MGLTLGLATVIPGPIAIFVASFALVMVGGLLESDWSLLSSCDVEPELSP